MADNTGQELIPSQSEATRKFEFNPRNNESYTQVVSDFTKAFKEKTGIGLDNLWNTDDSTAETWQASANLPLIAYTGERNFPETTGWCVFGNTETVYDGEVKTGREDTLVLSRRIHGDDKGVHPRKFELTIKTKRDLQGKIVGGEIEVIDSKWKHGVPDMRGEFPEQKSSLKLGNFHGRGITEEPIFQIGGWGDMKTIALPREGKNIRRDKVWDSLKDKLADRSAFLQPLQRGISRVQAGEQAKEVNNILNGVLDYIPSKGQYKLTNLGQKKELALA